MLRSKPIGWITAGTLLCVAGVALACRFRDNDPPSGDCNAAACPAVAAEIKEAKGKPESLKKEKPPAMLPEFDKKPAVGEMVTPAAVVAEPKEKKKEKQEKQEKVISDVVAPVPTVADSVPTPPSDEKSAGPSSAPPPPMANLLPPENEVIRPVSAREIEKSSPATAALPDTPSSDKELKPDNSKCVDEKKEPKTIEASAPSGLPPPPPSTDKKEDAVPASAVPTSAPPGVTAPPPPPAEPTSPTPCPGPITSPVSPEATRTTTPTTPSAPPSGTIPPTDNLTVHTPAPLYKVRGKGETLRDIAARTLGNGDRWQELYRLNPELQPDLIVPSGKQVILPPEAHVDAAKPDNPMEGGQSESEHVPPSASGLRPLPVIRPRIPVPAVKNVAPLTGTYSCQVENHSLVLPKEAIEQLGKVETMLLTPGPDRCLWLGTQSSAVRVLDRIEKSDAADRDIQAFRRLYFSQTEKAKVDGSGKMMISEKLAEFAGLSKEVVLVGIDDHFELWDAAHWQRYSQQKEPSTKP